MKVEGTVSNMHTNTVEGGICNIYKGNYEPVYVQITYAGVSTTEILSLRVEEMSIAVKVKDVEKVIKEARESRGDRA